MATYDQMLMITFDIEFFHGLFILKGIISISSK